jgi:hypothetical protein
VGFWEYWDHRNQRTVEYHNDRARGRDLSEDLKGAFDKRFLGMYFAVQVVGGVLARLVGDAWSAGIFFVVATVGFGFAYRSARRHRRQWEAAHPE